MGKEGRMTRKILRSEFVHDDWIDFGFFRCDCCGKRYPPTGLANNNGGSLNFPEVLGQSWRTIRLAKNTVDICDDCRECPWIEGRHISKG